MFRNLLIKSSQVEGNGDPTIQSLTRGMKIPATLPNPFDNPITRPDLLGAITCQHYHVILHLTPLIPESWLLTRSTLLRWDHRQQTWCQCTGRGWRWSETSISYLVIDFYKYLQQTPLPTCSWTNKTDSCVYLLQSESLNNVPAPENTGHCPEHLSSQKPSKIW